MAAMRVRPAGHARNRWHDLAAWASAFRSGILSLLPRHRAQPRLSPPFRRKILFEALEPRLLLSGDPLSVVLPDGATITVNSAADTNERDDKLTLREAILLNNRQL